MWGLGYIKANNVRERNRDTGKQLRQCLREKPEAGKHKPRQTSLYIEKGKIACLPVPESTTIFAKESISFSIQ